MPTVGQEWSYRCIEGNLEIRAWRVGWRCLSDLRASSLKAGRISSWSHAIGNEVDIGVVDLITLSWAQMRIDEIEDGDISVETEGLIYASPDTAVPISQFRY